MTNQENIVGNPNKTFQLSRKIYYIQNLMSMVTSGTCLLFNFTLWERFQLYSYGIFNEKPLAATVLQKR